MTDHKYKRELRKQRRLEALGTNTPICPCCGETDWRCFDAHHITGRAHDDVTTPVCKNCHAKLSDAQYDHPPKQKSANPIREQIGRFLLGLADMLKLVAEKLIEFGKLLIESAESNSATGELS